MNVVALALALATGPSGPPPGQKFNFSAHFNMDVNQIHVFETRMIQGFPNGKATLGAKIVHYPAYRWSLPYQGVRVRFVPISGQKTMPKTLVRTGGIHNPIGAGGGPEAAAELCRTRVDVDWTGCTPGLYRMEATAEVKGQDRNWREKFDHQVFYWRPVPGAPKQSWLSAQGQRYLITQRKPARVQVEPANKFAGLYGQALTVTGSPGEYRFDIPIRLQAKNGTTIRTYLHFGFPTQGIDPVMEDSEVINLRRMYRGKTLYPMTGGLVVVTEGSNPQYRPILKGETSVVIRDIWRAATPQQLGQIEPGLMGNRSEQLTGWYPLFVVFDVKSSNFWSNQRKSEPGPFIALLPDAWAFEREFSATSKKQDFKTWKPKPGSLDHPVFPEPGMTPKQLAWLRCWPTYLGPLTTTLKLSEWRFQAYRAPDETFRFKNGRLLPGKGVVSYRVK